MQRYQTNRNPALDSGSPTDMEKMSTWNDEETVSFSLSDPYQPLDHGASGAFDGQHWTAWDGVMRSAPWNHPTPSSEPSFQYSSPNQDDFLQTPPHNSEYGVLPAHAGGLRNYYVPVKNNPYQGAGPTHVGPLPNVHPNVQYQDLYTGPTSYYTQPSIPPQYTQPPPPQQYNASNHFIPGPVHFSYPAPHPQISNLPIRQQTPNRTVPSSSTEDDPSIFINTFLNPSDSILSHPLTLDWSPTTSDDNSSLSDLSPIMTVTAPKRKHSASPLRTVKSEVTSEPMPPRKGMSDFLVIFENSPGALASVKKRKKLDEPVRKAAKDVRKAGACHQCRFRKRTCGTGTPCGTCLKQGSALCELKCQRESPFLGKLMHRYFEHSSTRRIVNFDLGVPANSSGNIEIINIDGIGNLSHPLRLRARRKDLSSLSQSIQDLVKSTEMPKKGQKLISDQESHPAQIILLEDSESLGQEVEQWAMEFTSKFIHAAGPSFYATTMAQILGTAYVKKGLPEAPLMTAMLRAASLAFVLRAGVKCSIVSSKGKSHQSPLQFRTVQARIDSIIYARLKLAERDLFGRLQLLIFRTAGCLGKDQLYPVALVMWQLMRMLSLGASHLSNIAERFHGSVTTPADHLHHCQRLLLSVHLALFRTSTPLLLDFRAPNAGPASPDSSSSSSSSSQRSQTRTPTPPPSSAQQSTGFEAPNFNRALLNNDDELCNLAIKMRKVVLDFRKKGLKKEMRGSMVWRPEVWELFRGVYDGL